MRAAENRLLLCVQRMSNKSAGESGDVTLRSELARHIDAPVLNKCELEQKKKKTTKAGSLNTSKWNK